MENNIINMLLDTCTGAKISKKYDKSSIKIYNKETRSILDNVEYRNTDIDGYRMSKFSKSDIIKDEYTGKKITIKRDLIKKGVADAQTDHIKPIKLVWEKKKSSINTTADDIKNAINGDYNLAMTAGSLNTSKGARSNTEYASKMLTEGKIDEETAFEMIAKEIVAEREIDKSIRATQISEVVSISIDGLINNSLEYAYTIVCDIIQIGQGRKTIKDSLLGEIKDIGTRTLMVNAGSVVAQKLPDNIASIVTEHPNIVTTIIGIATIFANNANECKKGNVDKEEFLDRISNDAIHFIGGTIGTNVGILIGEKTIEGAIGKKTIEYLTEKLPILVAKKLPGVAVTGMGFITKTIIEAAIKGAELYIDKEINKSKQNAQMMSAKYEGIRKSLSMLSLKSNAISCGKYAVNMMNVYGAECAIRDGVQKYDITLFLDGINSLNHLYGNGMYYNEHDFEDFCEMAHLLEGEWVR